jgi:hypothetical protein
MATSPVPASIASFEPILKNIYDKRAPVLAYDEHVMLGLVPKNTKFMGKLHVQTVRFEGGQGRSAVFTKAKNNQAPNAYRDFLINRFNDFYVGTIDGEALEAAKGGDYTMAEGLEAEISGGFTTFGISLGATIYGNGDGIIGQIASGFNTPTVTLTDPSQSIKFAVGMTIGATALAGSAGVQKPGTVQIIAIDNDAGTLTVAGNWNAAGNIPTLAANDFLGVDGDLIQTIGGPFQKFPGLDGWLPAIAPVVGGPLFYGVDRGVDPVKLAGIRYNGLGASKAETWQKVMGICKQYGAKIDTGLMHPLDVAALTIGLGSEVRRIRTKANETPLVGYDGFEVVGATGTVRVYGDPDCPLGTAYGLKMDTWELRTLGKCPKFLESDGNHILRSADADAYEFRVGCRGAIRCTEPKNNVRITF